MSLGDKLSSREAVCGVIGLGYVGLPLLVRLGRAGYKAVGLDISEARCAQLNRGESYIGDVKSEEVAELVAVDKLMATTDMSVIANLDTINICVPTPLGKSREPDMSFITEALRVITQYLRPDQLIILESTTYPGTTDEMVVPTLEKSGLKCGVDFYAAFSPERIDPGNEQFPMERIPKVVGGVTPKCTELAVAYYQPLVEKVVPVSSARTAEMVKLLENTYRIVNIGMVNELALLADDLDVDVWEVVDAAKTKPFGFMPFYPGPGLGGHCIPVDPFYLSWKVRECSGQEAQFIELAGEINRKMPAAVVEKITLALNDHCQSVRGSRILILGATYKKDVADVRESAALDIIEVLQKRGADVVYNDPFVAKLRIGKNEIESIDLTPGELERADCVVIVANHSQYDYEMITRLSSVLVDTRNVTAGLDTSKTHVYRLGASRNSNCNCCKK